MWVCFFATVVIACSGVVRAQTHAPPTPAVRRWIQGLEARKDTFNRLRAKVKKMAEGPSGNVPDAVPSSLFCPVALESALVLALTEAHLTSGSNEEFHLVFNGPREKERLDLSYTYNSRGVLVLTSVDGLPSDWKLAFQPGEANSNKFIVITDEKTGCLFQFDSADPFASRGVAAQHE